MMHKLDDLSHQLLAAAKAAGADAADAMAVSGTSLSIDVRSEKLEQAERSEGIEIGLRVILGAKQATVSASDTRPETLQEMATRAMAMAQHAPDDPSIGLADPNQLATDCSADALELCDPKGEPAPAHLQEAAQMAEAAAMAQEGITQVQSATAGYSSREVYLAASNGFAGGYTRTDSAVSCVAIAGSGENMERDYDGDMRIFQEDLRNAEDIGKGAGQRAVERLGGRKSPTGSFPVLFDERISSSLIGHLLAAANGSAIARGSSWLRDSLGAQILPKNLSVVEDPRRARVTGSRPFDAEGLPTKLRKIIDDGVLTGWTLDLATGRKLEMPSTSNAARGTSAPPSPSNWNVALTQGSQTPAELIAQMGTGLLVTSMIGSTINPTTGDYSRGASGFWIENGEIAYPVNECTIAGNLRDMLKTMQPANDARMHMSRVVPSLLIEGMTLAGA